VGGTVGRTAVTEVGEAPDLSVILPCHNGLPWLSEQLDALCAQRDPGSWELIVVDNASHDASVAVATAYADRLPLRVAAAPTVANISYARNVGVAAARADKLAFLDADDQVGPHWVHAMRTALDHHALVAGVNVPDTSTSSASAAGISATAAPIGVPVPVAFLPYAGGGALGVRRAWYDRVGGFDLTLGRFGAEDVAFSWDVQLAGGHFGVAPLAINRYRTRPDAASAFRQQRARGVGQAMLFARYRQAGMPRSGALEVLMRWGALATTGVLVPFSAQVRGRWLGTLARRWGRVVGSWRERVLYL